MITQDARRVNRQIPQRQKGGSGAIRVGALLLGEFVTAKGLSLVRITTVVILCVVGCCTEEKNDMNSSVFEWGNTSRGVGMLPLTKVGGVRVLVLLLRITAVTSLEEGELCIQQCWPAHKKPEIRPSLTFLCWVDG